MLLSLLILTSCGAKQEPQIITQTEYVTKTIPVQAAPKPVQLNEIKWYVVTQDNLESFIEQFQKDNGSVAFMAISVRGYENLSLNVQDLRRYILQQKSIIAYYEKSVQNSTEAPADIAQ